MVPLIINTPKLTQQTPYTGGRAHCAASTTPNTRGETRTTDDTLDKASEVHLDPALVPMVPAGRTAETAGGQAIFITHPPPAQGEEEFDVLPPLDDVDGLSPLDAVR